MAMVDWGKIEKRSSPTGGNFLKLTEGKHRIRLVGKAFEYVKHWDPINVSCNGKEGGCPLCLSGNEKDVARKRYAINILHRDDSNKLKILDAGPQVFTAFRDYFESTQIDPGGKEGPDLVIKVEVPGGDQRRKKYSIIPLNKAEFTKEEVAMIKEKGLHDLTKIFGPKSSDEIKKMMSGAPAGGSSGGSAASSESGGAELSDNDLKW